MDADAIREIGRQRYESKRNAGISDFRSDGSRCSIDNDIDAAGAECFAAELCGQKFNDFISVGGDAGYDFRVMNMSVEVVWLGRWPSGRPREHGHLIINPHEPKRWADLYFVIRGGLSEGYVPAGWISHGRLVSFPLKDFGFGHRFAAHTAVLFPHEEFVLWAQGEKTT